MILLIWAWFWWGADRAGMEELDMDEEARPEFACPYCYEDHDVASLCAHLD